MRYRLTDDAGGELDQAETLGPLVAKLVPAEQVDDLTAKIAANLDVNGLFMVAAISGAVYGIIDFGHLAIANPPPIEGLGVNSARMRLVVAAVEGGKVEPLPPGVDPIVSPVDAAVDLADPFGP